MEREMSRRRKMLFVVTCWLTGYSVMWQMPIRVIASELYRLFPGQTGVVTALLSWPVLMTAVSSLLAARLLRKITTKSELIFSVITLLFLITAPAGENIWWVMACSVIAAFGAGFANTAGMAILSEVFTDERERSRQIGFYNSAMFLIGAVFIELAGVLAAGDWRRAFAVNWIAVPTLILSVLFLPAIRPEERGAAPAAGKSMAEEGETAPARRGLGARFWVFFASMFLFYIAYDPISSYLSLYISENGLGGTAYTGTCISLSTLGSCITAALFGFLYEKIHRLVSVLMLAVLIALYAVMMAAPSVPGTPVICFLGGCTYGFLFTLCYAYGAEIVPKARIASAMGLMTFNYSVAVPAGIYLSRVLQVALGSLTASLIEPILVLAAALLIETAACVYERWHQYH